MDVRGWLQANGFERFVDLFEENEIDGDVISELTDSDLASIGIPLGPRKKLLKAIGSLSASQETTIEAVQEPYPGGNRARQRSAERRHLTVMFVDLVGSTALSEKIDPEDMSDVITSYQTAVADAVTPFKGHIARYMGDGVLCYFGWPAAHEDDAERSVRAGLAIMQKLQALETPEDEELMARVGIATGLVVVGDLIGEGAAQEETVVGDTPNLAARLQGLARPKQVVVAESTKNLLGDLFEFLDLGPNELKGVSGKPSAYAIVGERITESRFASRSAGLVSTMVGRDQELALMAERWKLAKAGEGQLVMLSGEAGIGKSRITRAMIDLVERESNVRVNLQCSPFHSDSSFYPVIQQMLQSSGIKDADSNDERLDKLEAVLINSDAALIGKLLGIETEQRYGPTNMTLQQQRARTLQALVDQLLALARAKPVLFVLEDAHWIDASTLEFLDLVIDVAGSERLLVVVTARPTFEYNFGGHPIVTTLALNRLGREQVQGIINKLSRGKKLPEGLIEKIVEKTDGVPLFVEELTKTVLESSVLEETDTEWLLKGPLNQLDIPATLHDSLMARLDRLETVKEVAQSAACIGRQFDFSLIESISPIAGGDLESALDQLVAAELIFRRGTDSGATYIFKHALVQDAAYESLLRTRRQAIHSELVTVLESSDQSRPEILAHHCEQSGQLEKAIFYWRNAGDVSLLQPAYVESIGHFDAALDLIAKLDDATSWRETELELQLQLGSVFLTKYGYGSVRAARAYSAAQRLLKKTGRTDLLVPVGYGMWIGHYIRGEHDEGYEVVRKLVQEADQHDDSIAQLVANRMLAATLIALGKQTQARQHLEIALNLYKPELLANFSEQLAQEPGVQIRGFLILNLFLLGFSDQAAQQLKLSMEAAYEIEHINTTCYAAWHSSVFGLMSQDEELVRKWNNVLTQLSREHGLLTWKSFSRFGELLLQSRSGDAESLDALADEFDRYTSRGDWLMIPFYMTEYARELLRHGRTDTALQVCQKTSKIIDRTKECWSLSELHRLRGEVYVALNRLDEAETWLLKAIEIAQEQESKAWELRAATSLAKMWAAQGDDKNARKQLQPIYEWFTEGFETADIMDAKSFLQSIS